MTGSRYGTFIRSDREYHKVAGCIRAYYKDKPEPAPTACRCRECNRARIAAGLSADG